MLTRRQFMTISGAAALAAPSLAFAGGTTRTFGGMAFGSFWRLTVPLHVDESVARARIEAVVAAVDAVFSPYRQDSDLTMFNSAQSTEWQVVSRPLNEVLAAGLEIASASDGAFDPTVGPAVARYGFGPIRNGVAGSYTQLTVGAQGIRKTDPGLCVDLCGIAKGYALDGMVGALDSMGIDSFLLDLGGELYGRGAHPEDRGWHVAIDTADLGVGPIALALDGRAIATSGNTVQGYRIGGRTYGHIIDPATDGPVQNRALSVSVIAASAALADGWATALMAVDHEKAIATARTNDLDALFILDTGGDPVISGHFADVLLT